MTQQLSQDELVQIVRRQTDYSLETILQKLDETGNDIEKIILDYNNIDIEERERMKTSGLSTNQKIFKTIRDFF